MTEKHLQAARDVALVVGLIGAAVAFGLHGQGELAATALGGVLGFVTPSRRAAPLAIALVGGALVTFGA